MIKSRRTTAHLQKVDLAKENGEIESHSKHQGGYVRVVTIQSNSLTVVISQLEMVYIERIKYGMSSTKQ